MSMEYRIKACDDYGYIPITEDIEDYEIDDIELEPMKKFHIIFLNYLKMNSTAKKLKTYEHHLTP